jgi:hypothetical protein
MAAAVSMPSGGATRYTQKAVQVIAGSADATVRAGFMLIPEIGLSSVM